MRLFLNPAVRRDGAFRGLFSENEYEQLRAYVSAHPEHQPTPLVPLNSTATAMDVAALHAKDETHRYGLNAFKITGVSYAVERLGADATRPGLVCATAGNHGRAVARVGRQKGVPCTIFLPLARTSDPIEARTRTARVESMREDGATVIEVAGSYEDAVRRATGFGRESGATVVSDTSWDGYEQIPRWIMAGYTQIFEEASRQWDEPPGVVVLQGGVGGLVCAGASWFAAHYGAHRPFIIAAEPERAACLLESAEAGRPTVVGGSLETIMAGLRCAEPSPLAWPTIAAGVDAFVTVSDSEAVDMMIRLAGAPDEERIDAGPSGVCGLAALREIALGPQRDRWRSITRLDTRARVLVVISEGASG